MFLPEDMKNMVEEIVSTYEERIQNISSVFDAGYRLAESVQDSLQEAKHQRQNVNVQVREILSRNEHLRKRDFDNMMRGILSLQDEREKEVRELLKGHLDEQREQAIVLRESLSKFRNSLAEGESKRTGEFRTFIRGIFAGQEKRREEVISRLKEFQKEQLETSNKLRELSDKGRDLRIRDLKAMLREFKVLHEERSAGREKRREQVRNMLESVNESHNKQRRRKNGNS